MGIFVEFCPWPHLPLKGVIVRPRYTLIRIFLKMEIFIFALAFLHTLKAFSSSPEIFEKPASRLNVDVGTITEVFEYSDAIHHILPALCVLRVRHTVILSRVLAFSCARAETIQAKSRVFNVWTCNFWKKEEKYLRFQEYPDTCRQGYGWLRSRADRIIVNNYKE